MLSPDRIREIAAGFRASEVLFAALELGLFTELGKGPRSYEQLRRALRLNERSALEFLETLVTLDLLRREGAGDEAIYLNTRESAHFLDSRSPAFIGRQLSSAHVRLAPLWQALTESVRSAEATSP
jgi:hypothetical protein